MSRGTISEEPGDGTKPNSHRRDQRRIFDLLPAFMPFGVKINIKDMQALMSFLPQN
ncbi:hypothetical protein V1291_002007 [Nitrobacteraceae bacterium AZCC 1564]